MSNLVSLAQSYTQAKEALGVHAQNLQRASDPNAKVITPNIKSDFVGGGLRTSLVKLRNSDPLREKVYANQISETAQKNTVSDFLQRLQREVFQGDKNPQQSKIINKVNEFFAIVNKVTANSTPPLKRAFIETTHSLTEVLSNASDNINKARLNADSDINSNITNLNIDIESLSTVNLKIKNSSNSIKFLDERDFLVRKIAEQLEINTSYNNEGTVIVTSKQSGEVIISNTSYVQFKYQGISSMEDLLNNTDIPPIIMSNHNVHDGRKFREIEVLGGNDGAKKISGGKLEGLVQLRDDILPKSFDLFKTFVGNFADKINEVHNNGSSIPPKSFFKSDIKVFGNQVFEWGDEPLSVYFVDKDGNQLKGGAGPLNPGVIDISKLRTNNPSGVCVKDFIGELNEKLNISPSRRRAALGEIRDNNGANNENLINNIQIAGASSIIDGNFTFDLDLQGNSIFGSTVEIVSITGPAGNVASEDLPNPFRLEKGENKRQGKVVTVGGLNFGVQNITVEIRVIGDNGVIETGTVTFQVDTANTDMLNKRIPFDGQGANIGGDFQSKGISHSGVGVVKLVDDDGFEVDPDSGRSGNLVIETNNEDYRLVLQGSNFSKLLGLNNMFNYDSRTGKISIKEEIYAEVNNLSSGRVEKTDGVLTQIEVGDARAQATMVFSAEPGINDTVTIGDHVFTFAFGPIVNDNDVFVSGNTDTTLENLRDTINSHPKLKFLVTAAYDATTNTITLTAKSPGVGSNNIVLGADLSISGNPATVDINTTGAAQNPANTTLGTGIAGTNKITTTKIEKYNLGTGSIKVLEDIRSLQNNVTKFKGSDYITGMAASLPHFAGAVVDLITNQANLATKESEVAQVVLTGVDNSIKEDFGIHDFEEYNKAIDVSSYLRTLANLLQMIRKSITETEEIIFG